VVLILAWIMMQESRLLNEAGHPVMDNLIPSDTA